MDEIGNPCPGCGTPVTGGKARPGGGMTLEPCGCVYRQLPANQIVVTGAAHAPPGAPWPYGGGGGGSYRPVYVPERAEPVGVVRVDGAATDETIRRVEASIRAAYGSQPTSLAEGTERELAAGVCTGCRQAVPPAGKSGLCRYCAELAELTAADRRWLETEPIGGVALRDIWPAFAIAAVLLMILAVALSGVLS